jgi:hypothetical protein
MPYFDLGFAPEELLIAARAARAAYQETEAEIRPYLDSCGLTGNILQFRKADCEGFLYHDVDSAIIAIRGSQTLGDWIYNANVELSPLAGHADARWRSAGKSAR